jgi:predicted Zn-dependent protease
MTRALAFAIFLLTACSTSPTGRSQLSLVSDSQMDKMGTQAFDEMKTKQKVDTGANVNAYVKCVANSITAVLPEKRNWEVVVFDDEQANAFALPGGKIGVYTGILKVAKTPDQLAAVLGHEVGHVLASHGKERVSEQMATQGGLSLIGAIMGNQSDTRRSILMGALGLGAQYGVALPHSRRQESEADAIGLDLMAEAGFDPHQSVELWKNMAAASGGKAPPEFASTHPSNQSRISGLEKGMGKAMEIYGRARNHPVCRM